MIWQIILPLGHTLTDGHSMLIIDGRNKVTNTPLTSKVQYIVHTLSFISFTIIFINSLSPSFLKKNESKNILINLRNHFWSQGCVQNCTQTTSYEYHLHTRWLNINTDWLNVSLYFQQNLPVGKKMIDHG
jgi:hypothetical protein